MRSGPIAATAALVSLALILPGCGEEGTATAGGGKEGASATSAPPPAAAKRCGAELGDFLDSIESLGNTLAVGLDYEQYLDSVNRVRASYASVTADRLGLVCLSRVAAPAEVALNTYIDAANVWGSCLASSSCDSESIEPELQREWERASNQVTQAQSGLRDLG
ncbi:MAG: hypothetical protein ABW196_01690 [Solirubrobacterales bacterium]